MPSPDGLDGRRRIAEGREAVIYEWEKGLVVRVMRSRDAGPGVHRSTAASEAARLAGVVTPRILEVLEIDGFPAQVMERIDGVDLLERLAANPLRLRSVTKMLVEVHVSLHRATAPPELATSHERFGARIETSQLVPSDLKHRALGVLAELPHGDAICHGDYHPGNVLLGADGVPTLIDWTGATRGDAIGDFARTRLMLQVGELPPGSPAAMRMLVGIGRGALWRLYEREYRRIRPIDADLLDRWTLVAATNRLTEDIPGERDSLLRIVGQAKA
jgi:aminoglycoside phosphotransferase (APT) family kinase protein